MGMMAFSFSLRVKLESLVVLVARASRTSGEQDGVAASGLAALGLPLGLCPQWSLLMALPCLSVLLQVATGCLGTASLLLGMKDHE